jgi:predicted  nucleic acid-binding Zn ribbon protein
MPAFEIVARPRPRKRQKLEDALQWLARALAKSGQVEGGSLVYEHGGSLHLVCRAPYARSLDPARHSGDARAAFAEIGELARRAPAVRRLDRERAPKDPPSLRKGAVLVLRTDMLDVGAPVRRGSDGARIPAYALGLEVPDVEALHVWADVYRATDRLWHGSGALELPAYRQLADPGSALSRRGRAVCRAIEAATGVATYYDLYRYHGRSHGEATRRCPCCGGSWAGMARPKWLRAHADFLCARCRLVSVIAPAIAPSRELAKIGDVRARRRSRRRGARRRSRGR